MPTARAVRVREPGGPEVLEHVDLEVRDPGPGEILVEVAATALNRADLLQRRGLYPAPPGAPPDVLGLEYAGRVSALGSDVSMWRVGDAVMGIVGGGGYATHVVVHEREAIPVPKGIELQEAAAIPEAFLTAYDALFLQAALQGGERVLIHAIASGVGTAALQLATTMGARVLGTSRTAAKLERCRDEVAPFDAILVEQGRFAEAVSERAGGVDVILDTVGGAYLEENLRSLALCGRMVAIGLMGGLEGKLSMGRLLRGRFQIRGSVLRTRSLEEKATLARVFAARIVPLFESGALRPVVDRRLPMAQVVAAHQQMEENQTFGKVVLHWD